MPVPWKAWKTNPRFPALPTAPWKTRQQREFPTFPQRGRSAERKVENQTQVSHFPSRTPRLLPRYSFPRTTPNPIPRSPAHPFIAPTDPSHAHADFRIILCWNQIPVSGSFLDWKMLGAGALYSWPVRPITGPVLLSGGSNHRAWRRPGMRQAPQTLRRPALP